MHKNERADYDVVIIGGAIAGAATAVLLKRWRPETSVLIVERTAEFDRKVGEATVEISGLFLSRVLGLYDHLLRSHLPKHGLRYWFADRNGLPLEQMAEVGTDSLPQMPSFQLDRSVLDEHVLEKARELGAEVLRPAKVVEVELERPENELDIEVESQRRKVRAKWVVDASGRRAYLARKLGLWETNGEHPPCAMWGRWTGVKDMDGKAVLGSDVRRPKMPFTRSARRLSTNHFGTFGSWTWVIPLSGGQTSIGLVWDRRHFDPPAGDTPRERFERHVRSASGLCELVQDARLDESDFKTYRQLPYRASKYMGPGWALVGDAAGFIDPYYSPGLDHVAYSVYASARIIDEHLANKLAPVGLALA
jgi:flavin-dependent dehydrogenase